MSVVHMTEAEIARDLHSVLEKVRQGVEVIIEENARPIAVLKATPRTGRPISECIALAKARGSKATMDDDFARDVEEGMRSHREPWNPPSWD
jgi:antitoxin (DNA-binding transcriptional repressor) of toxin-antitoxin stability system